MVCQEDEMNTTLNPDAIANLRDIGIFAHIDAGKTTTSEAVLYFTGRIHRIGSVDEGNTQLDWMEQERARGITITAAATSCVWQGCRINLIDTPGHIDFTVEVMRSMRVIDGAVVVLCGVGGVETQTETVWRHADRQNLPRLIFINKLDREYADFVAALESVHHKLTHRTTVLQLPIGSGSALRGVVDLLDEQALIWEEGVEEPRRQPIPGELTAKAARMRSQLVDQICESDEALMTAHLEGRDLPAASLRSALRRAVINGALTPVLCGSARQRIGIQPLLDAVVDYLPAPCDTPPTLGILPGSEEIVQRSAAEDQPFSASAFKIVSDPHVGHLTWVRIFSGKLHSGQALLNPRTNDEERISRIYQIHANRRQNLEQARAGDVVALVGLKSAVTGDTLCDPAHPLQFERFTFPEPVIAVALSPSTDQERDRLQQCVGHLCAEDPTLRLSFDPETGEQVLSGMGELHLEIAVDRLRSEYGILARPSPLQIAYRETIRSRAEATGSYRRQTGGHGHFAVVRLRVEPLNSGAGIQFASTAPPTEVPEQFVRAAEGGLREALDKGVIAGYALTDIQVTLLGGKFHEIDSNSLDFRIAGSMAVRQAVQQANPALLEPIMRANINVYDEYLGTVLGDFARRRGAVHSLAVHGKRRDVEGEVPLAEVRGYATDLRDMTEGRGSFTLELLRYDIVPDRLAESIIAQREREGKLQRR